MSLQIDQLLERGNLKYVKIAGDILQSRNEENPINNLKRNIFSLNEQGSDWHLISVTQDCRRNEKIFPQNNEGEKILNLTYVCRQFRDEDKKNKILRLARISGSSELCLKELLPEDVSRKTGEEI